MINNKIWHDRQHIALYYSIEKEVDTLSLIKFAWQHDKVIYIPLCVPEDRKLLFYKVDSFEQLKSSHYGIPEPDPSLCCPLEVALLECVVVPGLLFNEKGYRLGYGGGYYDRFLSKISNKVETISLAFHFQLVDDGEFPIYSYDLPVDKIVTTSKIIDCRENR